MKASNSSSDRGCRMTKAVGASTVLACIMATLVATDARAQITVFRDRASFDAVVGSTVVETFTAGPHFPIASGVLNSKTAEVVAFYEPIRPGDILPGATYSRATNIGTRFGLNIDAWGQGMQGGYLDGFHGTTSNPGLTITLDQPVQAFGFDTNLFMGTTFRVAFEHGGGSFSQVFPVQSYEYSFFGFGSDAADIQSIDIEGRGNRVFRFGLDNFTTPGVTPPIPEAPITALLGASLGLWAWRDRHQFKSGVFSNRVFRIRALGRAAE